MWNVKIGPTNQKQPSGRPLKASATVDINFPKDGRSFIYKGYYYYDDDDDDDVRCWKHLRYCNIKYVCTKFFGHVDQIMGYSFQALWKYVKWQQN